VRRANMVMLWLVTDGMQRSYRVSFL